MLLTDADTGQPAAVIIRWTITNAWTACIGALTVRTFAPAMKTFAAIETGAQARWQTRTIAAVADLADVRIYSPSASREAYAGDLSERGLPARAAETPAATVEGGRYRRRGDDGDIWVDVKLDGRCSVTIVA